MAPRSGRSWTAQPLSELPVRHQTRRQGRPYTLVLTKTEAIFEQGMEKRRQDEADLAWLRQTYANV